jgi:hypothetical protein
MSDPNDPARPDRAAPPAPPVYGAPGPSRPVAAPPGIDYPGKTLGIIGLILAFVFTIAGLVCSIVALVQSRRAGYRNGIALAGVIVSAAFIVIGIIVSLVVVLVLIAGCNNGATWCTAA